MPKLVEYPEERHGAGTPPVGGFDADDCFESRFTISELEVSGYLDWYSMGDEHESVLPLVQHLADLQGFVEPMQALVQRVFEKGASGAIRELWLRGVYDAPQLRDTVLTRFPLHIGHEVRQCLDAVALAGAQEHDRFVQCVAMLHAYTRMPSGEKSPELLAADRAALAGGLAGQFIERIRLARPA